MPFFPTQVRWRRGMAMAGGGCFWVWALAAAWAGDPFFRLPTENRALFEPGGLESYFVATPGRTWASGTYGCVRSEGRQFHEGLDIAPLHRDRRGEATDPILAAADGTVAYANRVAGNSAFGNYLVLRHQMEGLEVFSLYAHLREIRRDLQPNQPVAAGETVGIMGRTANTRSGISKDRAHLHFEITLLLSDRYAAWHRQHTSKGRNDHGNWNGYALLGMDPWAVFLAQRQKGTNFSLVRFLHNQTELCRVWIAGPDFPFAQRHPPLIRPNPLATQEGIAGYEVALNYAGLPFEIIPRAHSEFQTDQRFELLSVNPEEHRRHPCRKLLDWRQGRWHLTEGALDLLDLMAY